MVASRELLFGNRTRFADALCSRCASTGNRRRGLLQGTVLSPALDSGKPAVGAVVATGNHSTGEKRA